MARLTGVFVTPGEVFDSVIAAPVAHSNWLLPALLFIVVSWCGAVLLFAHPGLKHQLQEIQEQAIQKQVESGKLTQQQADQIIQVTSKYAGVGAIIGGFAGPVIVGFASPFFWGLLLWLAGLLFQRPFPYWKGVEAVGLSNTIAVLEAAAHWLLVAAMGNLFVSLSPALLFKGLEPTSFGYSALGAFSVIGLWCLGVRAVGLARLTGISFLAAAAWVFGTYYALVMGALAVGQMLQRLGGR